MTYDEIEQSAIDNMACPYCGEGPGHPCRTRSAGKIARYTHGARVWPIQNAWGAGYRDGEKDALDMAASNPEWFARRIERHIKER